MSLPNEEKTYLALPTDSWDCESIVGSYPLDSLEVVDSEFDIDGISRIVYDNFGYCLFQRLAVPRIAVHRIAMLRLSLPVLSVVPIITQLTSMAVLALHGHQVTDPAQVGKPLSQGLQHPSADVILPLGVGEFLSEPDATVQVVGESTIRTAFSNFYLNLQYPMQNMIYVE